MNTPTFVDKNDPASYPLAIRDILIKNVRMLADVANQSAAFSDIPLARRTFASVDYQLSECVFNVSDLKTNAQFYSGDQPVKEVVQQLSTLVFVAGDQTVRATFKGFDSTTVVITDIAPVMSPQGRDMTARYCARRINALADQIGFFSRKGKDVAVGGEARVADLPGHERHFEAYFDMFQSAEKEAGSIEEETGIITRPSWNLPAGELESADERPTAPLLPADKPAVGIKPWVKGA